MNALPDRVVMGYDVIFWSALKQEAATDRFLPVDFFLYGKSNDAFPYIPTPIRSNADVRNPLDPRQDSRNP